MTRAAGQGGFSLAALRQRPDRSLLASPLQYIAADLYRQRMMCATLERMAAQEQLDARAAAAVLAFLQQDLPLHMRDTEDDLFPLLRQRARAEDRLDELFDRLQTDHASATNAIDAVCAVLQGQGADAEAWPPVLAAFAANGRRHLTIENAILLPLGQARLTAGDLLALGRSMAARRGLKEPG